MNDDTKAETSAVTVMTAEFAAVPPAPTIEVPAIQREGYTAILAGWTMREPSAPEGFTFCQYPHGSVERENFLAGCARAVFKGANVQADLTAQDLSRRSGRAPGSAAQVAEKGS